MASASLAFSMTFRLSDECDDGKQEALVDAVVAPLPVKKRDTGERRTLHQLEWSWPFAAALGELY